VRETTGLPTPSIDPDQCVQPFKGRILTGQKAANDYALVTAMIVVIVLNVMWYFTH
jgi:hypothetical protein